DSIGRITMDGDISVFHSPLITGPFDLTAGPDGTVWFTNLGAVRSMGRITTEGEVTAYRSFPGDATFGAGYLTTAADGAVWFTLGSISIARMAVDGTISTFDDPTISVPFDVTTGPDGALWYGNGNNSIGRIAMPASVPDAPFAVTALSSSTNV